MDAAKCAERAMEVIQKFEQGGSKGFLMSFGTDPPTGRSVSVWNYAAFYPGAYRTPEDWATCFAALYYLCEASTSNISVIRFANATTWDGAIFRWKWNDTGRLSFKIAIRCGPRHSPCYMLP